MKNLFKSTPNKFVAALALTPLLAATFVARADLTHRYSFNDDIASTNAIDSVGGANGSLYPGASYPGDGTVSLDGASGFVYLPDDIISNYTSVSFEVWTTPTSNPQWARLFDFGSNTGGPGTGGTGSGTSGINFTYLTLNDNNNLLRGDLLSATGESIIEGPQPAVGVTHHLVLAVDAVAKTGTLFDDGKLVSFNNNFPITPQAVGHTFNDYIGRSQYGDPYYVGSIDEFRIYDDALGRPQVEADYEAGPSSITASPGALNSLEFNNPTNVLLGGIFTPDVLASYAGLTNSVDVTGLPGIVYSSLDPSVIEFGTNGFFKALTAGTATIQATYQSTTANLTVYVGTEALALRHRWSFDGAAGTTAINDSIGGATGTLMNGSSTATLTGSGQLTLDGNLSDGYVALPSGILPTLTNVTFQVWVNYSGDYGATWSELYSFGTNNGASGIAYTTLIPHNGANGKLRWGINQGGEVDIDGQSELVISNEVLVTVAYNYSAQTASIYVGGRKVGTGSQSKALFTIPDGDNYFGRSQFSSDPYFFGSLDEMRIYEGVKSDLQIAIDAVTGPDSLDTVTDPGALSSISLAVTNSINIHDSSVPMSVTANFANVSGVEITTLAGTTITSSNPNTATIVNGALVAQNPGTTTVTATYGGISSSVSVTVYDPSAWPSLLHRYTFNDAPGSTTLADSVGTIDGTVNGPAVFDGNQLIMPAGNPVSGTDGLPTANSGWVSFPAGEGLINTLPDQASFEIWVVWNGGAVWQEMFDFGIAATPGYSLGGEDYVMITPQNGSGNNLLRVEWRQASLGYDMIMDGTTAVPVGVLSQVVWTHDQLAQSDSLYLNGQLVNTAVNTGLWSTLADTDNWLARDEWQDAMFNGNYEDFRIWNGALTPAQVANLYKAGPNVIGGPGLQISVSGNQATLTWPANTAGFVLQSTTDLATGTWSDVSGTPTVVNGLNTLTVGTSGTQVFYRLKQ